MGLFLHEVPTPAPTDWVRLATAARLLLLATSHYPVLGLSEFVVFPFFFSARWYILESSTSSGHPFCAHVHMAESSPR